MISLAVVKIEWLLSPHNFESCFGEHGIVAESITPVDQHPEPRRNPFLPIVS